MKAKLILFLTLISISVFAQNVQPAAAPAPAPAYGEPISLANARKVFAAAEAYAVSKQWSVVIVIVDTGGNLVLLEKLDNTQIGSIDVAIGKAKTANNFKRATKVFEDAIVGGGIGLRVLSLPGAVPVEGGELIISGGKIIGAIGVSGVQATQDGEVAGAGAATLK